MRDATMVLILNIKYKKHIALEINVKVATAVNLNKSL